MGGTLDIVARAEAAGVGGTAGAGYPLHDRLSRRVRTVIANGAECEPILGADRAVLVRYAEQVLQGLVLAMEAADASRGIVAVRGTDFEAVNALTRARRRFPHVALLLLEDYYPVGDERALVREALGEQLLPGTHPEDAGVMVINVQTLWLLSEAARGRPVTHRFVSVVGELKTPQTLRVPLGTTLEELLALCGGPTKTDVSIVRGGPLRGVLAGIDDSVGLTTSCVMVLPTAHALIQRRLTPLDQLLARAGATCGGCRQCTDRCPQHLQGYAIRPHLLMRGVLNRQADNPEVVLGAGSCSGCRLCEAICPAGLSPGRLYQAVGADLRARGFAALPQGPSTDAHQALADRKTPRSWLEQRLGLSAYASPLPIDDNYPQVNRIQLPLKGHTPTVRVGEKVEAGALLATPAGLGLRVHSPIAGRVVEVSGTRLELARA